jgi:hypothetical protein
VDVGEWEAGHTRAVRDRFAAQMHTTCDWYSCAVREGDAIDQGGGYLRFSRSTLFIMVTKRRVIAKRRHCEMQTPRTHQCLRKGGQWGLSPKTPDDSDWTELCPVGSRRGLPEAQGVRLRADLVL